jgi:hypothetical protein
MEAVCLAEPYVVFEAEVILLYGGFYYGALAGWAAGWLKKRSSACRYCTRLMGVLMF